MVLAVIYPVECTLLHLERCGGYAERIELYGDKLMAISNKYCSLAEVIQSEFRLKCYNLTS